MVAVAKRPPGPRRRDWTGAFLQVLANEGTVTAACVAAKVGRSTVYRRRSEDPAFAEAWDDIDAAVVDVLEHEAVRRALEGSDRMLEFVLKAKRPEVYRDNVRLEHSGLPAGVTAEELRDAQRHAEARRRAESMTDEELDAFMLGAGATSG
jgi:hypothetical protein